MKTLLLIPAILLMTACATGSKSASRLNCEKLEADSHAKLVDMQKMFVAYQDINYDLAVKLSPPLKEQVSELDERIKKQKQRCWQGEKKDIDNEMALLKDELYKVYGGVERKEKEPKKLKRTMASAEEAPKPVVESEKEDKSDQDDGSDDEL